MFCFLLICDNSISNFDCGAHAHMRICKLLWQLSDKQGKQQSSDADDEKFNIDDILLQPSLLLEPDKSYYLSSSIAILYYFIKEMPPQQEFSQKNIITKYADYPIELAASLARGCSYKCCVFQKMKQIVYNLIENEPYKLYAHTGIHGVISQLQVLPQEYIHNTIMNQIEIS